VPKSVLTEYRLELSGFLCAVSAFVTLVGVTGVFLLDQLPSYLFVLQELAEPFGSWAYWFLVGGPLLLVGAGWWLYDYFKKTRALARLIATPSKAKFVRNMDENRIPSVVVAQAFRGAHVREEAPVQPEMRC